MITYTENNPRLVTLLTSGNDTVYKFIIGELHQYGGSILTDTSSYVLYLPNHHRWYPVLLHTRFDTVLDMPTADVSLDLYQVDSCSDKQDLANRAGVYVALECLKKSDLHFPVLFTTGKYSGLNNAVFSGDLDILENFIHAIVDLTLCESGPRYTCQSHTPENIKEYTDKYFAHKSTNFVANAEVLSAEYNVPLISVSNGSFGTETSATFSRSIGELIVDNLVKLVQEMPEPVFEHPRKNFLIEHSTHLGTAAHELSELDTVELVEETPRCSICGKRKYPNKFFGSIAGCLCYTCEAKVRKASGTNDINLLAWAKAKGLYNQEKVRSKLANIKQKVLCPKCGSANCSLHNSLHGICKDCNTLFYMSLVEDTNTYFTDTSAVSVKRCSRKIVSVVPTPDWFDHAKEYSCIVCGSEIRGVSFTEYTNGCCSVRVCDDCNKYFL